MIWLVYTLGYWAIGTLGVGVIVYLKPKNEGFDLSDEDNAFFLGKLAMFWPLMVLLTVSVGIWMLIDKVRNGS